MLPFFSDQFGNAGSRHSYGTAAAFHVAAARQQVAQLIGALSPDEIVFTAGATESNAMATPADEIPVQIPHRPRSVHRKDEIACPRPSKGW